MNLSINATNNASQVGLMNFGKKAAKSPEPAINLRSIMAAGHCSSCNCKAPDGDTLVLSTQGQN